MAIELTPDRIEAFRERVEPALSPIQRLAAEHIWEWLDELWLDEAVPSQKLEALADELLPRLEAVASSQGRERDAAIVRTVEFLRSLDMGHLLRG